MTDQDEVVHPFGVDPLAVSRLFMHEDLARSGLTAADFPIPPEPIPSVSGRACYKMHYTKDYYKLKVDRDVNKYVGLKGVVPPIVSLGFGVLSEASPVIASVEGLKKAVLFHKTTGIPTLAIDSCWSFGETVDTIGEVKVKNLHNDILVRLYPDQSHIVLFDGDWATNDNVRLGLSTYKILLEEYGSELKFKNLGDVGGYDDWFIKVHGADDATWPTSDDVIQQLFLDVPDVPNESLLGCPLSFAIGSSKRLDKSLLDHTDRGAASLVVALYGEANLRYCRDISEWVVWSGTRWENVGHRPLGLVNRAAQYYFDRAAICNHKAGIMEGKPDLADKMTLLLAEAKACIKFARAHCSSTHGRNSILIDMEARKALWAYKDAFDQSSWLLGVANGVVDLRTGTLREEQQSDMILRRCPVEYIAEEPAVFAGSNVPKLKRFLHQVTAIEHGKHDAALLYWLWLKLGACLRGENALTSLEIWSGTGANGKTVLSNLIQKVLGDSDEGGYACSTNAGVILSAVKSRDAESSTPFLVKLLGARIVFMSETKDTQYLNEPLVKQLTGGDKVAARGNYQDAHTYNVTFNPILLTNAMPNIAEGGDALWDRLSAIPFSCRWERNGKALTETSLKHPVADSWFRHELLQDRECLQWFLWWLVQGAALWEVEGMPDEVPERVQKLMGTYRAKNNPFEELVFDCGLGVTVEPTEDPHKCIPSAIIYSIYRQHTLDNGNTPVAQKTFTMRLLSQFPQLTLGQTRIDGVLMRVIFGIYRVK